MNGWQSFQPFGREAVKIAIAILLMSIIGSGGMALLTHVALGCS